MSMDIYTTGKESDLTWHFPATITFRNMCTTYLVNTKVNRYTHDSRGGGKGVELEHQFHKPIHRCRCTPCTSYRTRTTYKRRVKEENSNGFVLSLGVNGQLGWEYFWQLNTLIWAYTDGWGRRGVTHKLQPRKPNIHNANWDPYLTAWHLQVIQGSYRLTNSPTTGK